MEGERNPADRETPQGVDIQESCHVSRHPTSVLWEDQD